jgi:hypothetical protein
MKWLAILVLAIALPIYGQEERPKVAADKSQAQSVKAPSPPPVPSAVNQQAAPAQEDRPNDNPKGYLCRLFSPENLPNIGLLVAGIVGIFIALRTLKTIDRQTKATEDAAEAALLSAKALLDAERPWLSVTVEQMKGSAALYQFSVKNLGRTPAMVIGTSVVRVVCEALPEIPEYPDGMSAVESAREESGEVRLLAPDETWKFAAVDMSGIEPGWLLGQFAFNDLKSGKRDFFYFGKVQYRDVFAPAVLHETHFCYIYKLADFLPFSKPGYNRYT